MSPRCIKFNSVDIDGTKSVLWCRMLPRAKVEGGMLTLCGIGVALPLDVKRRAPTCHYCKTGEPR
jgi:hypothetical protein